MPTAGSPGGRGAATGVGTAVSVEGVEGITSAVRAAVVTGGGAIAGAAVMAGGAVAGGRAEIGSSAVMAAGASGPSDSAGALGSPMSTGVPHSVQNRASGSKRAPQFVQKRGAVVEVSTIAAGAASDSDCGVDASVLADEAVSTAELPVGTASRASVTGSAGAVAELSGVLGSGSVEDSDASAVDTAAGSNGGLNSLRPSTLIPGSSSFASFWRGGSGLSGTDRSSSATLMVCAGPGLANPSNVIPAGALESLFRNISSSFKAMAGQA